MNDPALYHDPQAVPEPAQAVGKIVRLPVPPQAIAMQLYTSEMLALTKRLDAKEITLDEFNEGVSRNVVGSIEAACRAQRAASGVMFEVLADSSPDIDIRRFAAKAAKLITGEATPEVFGEQKDASRIILPGQE